VNAAVASALLTGAVNNTRRRQKFAGWVAGVEAQRSPQAMRVRRSFCPLASPPLSSVERADRIG